MPNTFNYSWSNIKVAILGKELQAIHGLTYTKSQEKEAVYGAGNAPLGIQRGRKKYTGTLVLLKSEFDRLNEIAYAAGYEDLVDVPGHLIDIVCTYSQQDSVLETDKLNNVEFLSYSDGANQTKGSEVQPDILISLPFICLQIKKG